MTDSTTFAIRKLNMEFALRHPEGAALTLGEMAPVEALPVLRNLADEKAAAILERMNAEVALPLLLAMDPAAFRGIFPRVDPARGAALLARLDEADRRERLEHLPRALTREYQELVTYPPASAGRLMDPAATEFRENETVEDALARIRRRKNRRITDLCVVDDRSKLLGTISLQTVAISEPGTFLKDLMETPPRSVQAMAPAEEVVRILETARIASLPVVDMDDRLLGIIRYDTLVAAAQQDVTEDLQSMFGAGREERALSPILFAVRKRLPWLEINLATAFLAAAVVGMFEDTIAKITALAIFLPVVAGQSGNTGSQALAVTMRGLALREVHIRSWYRLAMKEAGVGLINGIVVALTTSLVAYVWMGSAGLAAVIGVAMVFSMVVAGFSGAVIPALLKAFGQDPAQSSSIILTTVTDIVGFLSFLGLAQLLLRTI